MKIMVVQCDADRKKRVTRGARQRNITLHWLPDVPDASPWLQAVIRRLRLILAAPPPPPPAIVAAPPPPLPKSKGRRKFV